MRKRRFGFWTERDQGRSAAIDAEIPGFLQNPATISSDDLL
jgi:hypothetical protein